MKKILFIFSILLIFSSFSSEKNSSIKSGEKLVFAGSYNMSGLMTQLAQITMTTETVTTAKNTYLHLYCEAATYSKWDSFFKIRDIYESYVNPLTLKPSLYKRSIDEGGFTKKEKYVFKGNRVSSNMKRKNRPETQKTFSVGDATQDVVSILYKLRTVDFSKYKMMKNLRILIYFHLKFACFRCKRRSLRHLIWQLRSIFERCMGCFMDADLKQIFHQCNLSG